MRSRRRRGCRFGLAIPLMIGIVGCGGAAHDDLPRRAISGTVTFDGQPLKTGFIQFHPATATEGMAAGGEIIDGRFDIPRDKGPVPGSYKVQINSLDEVPPPAVDADQMPGEIQIPDRRTVSSRPIPPRYNAHTELTAVVSPDKENTYKFDLEK